MKKLALAVIASLLVFNSPVSAAQKPLKICMNKTTGAIVAKTKCKGSEYTLSYSNFASWFDKKSTCEKFEQQCSVDYGYISTCSIDCNAGKYVALHGVDSDFIGRFETLEAGLEAPLPSGHYRKVNYSGGIRSGSSVNFTVQAVCCTE